MSVILSFCFLYGYGFFSGGKSHGREILHACWPSIRTGLLPFGGQWSKVKVARDKNALSAAKPHPACVRMVCALQTVAAAAPADERISWRARGDIGGGVHRGSELGQRRRLRPYGGACVMQAC